MRIVILAALLLSSCAVFDSTRPHERALWIKNHADSKWREHVEKGQLVMGMPKDAVFASWNFGCWSQKNDSMDSLGSSETWSHTGTGSYIVVCFRNGALSYFDRWR